MKTTPWAWLTPLILVPGAADAHLVSTRFGELYSGLLHPLTALQHLVPWIALALLGGLQDTRTARWALIAFPISVGCGVVTADLAPGMAYATSVNAASFIVLGLLVAIKKRLPLIEFMALAVIIGITHGYANAATDVQGFGALLYVSGVTLAAYLIITLGTASSHSLAGGPAWGSIAIRAVGSWIAAVGLIYAGFLATA